MAQNHSAKMSYYLTKFDTAGDEVDRTNVVSQIVQELQGRVKATHALKLHTMYLPERASEEVKKTVRCMCAWETACVWAWACLCVYIYICIYICIYLQICTYVHVPVHEYMYMNTYPYKHCLKKTVHTQANLHTYFGPIFPCPLRYVSTIPIYVILPNLVTCVRENLLACFYTCLCTYESSYMRLTSRCCALSTAKGVDSPIMINRIVYIHMHVYTYIYMYLYLYMYVYIHICMCICLIHTYMHMSMNKHVYTWKFVYVSYVCVCLCLCRCLCVCAGTQQDR